MTDDIVFGSGVPQWSFARVLTEIVERSSFPIDKSTLRPKVDLSEELRDAPLEDENLRGWRVRNQHARGTCNAFAVVAAEELRRFIVWKGYTPLSEEYLYEKALRKPPTRVPNPVTGIAADRFKELGGTYLGQLADALIKDGIADAKDVAYKPFAPAKPPDEARVFESSVESIAAGRKVEPAELFHDITSEGVGPKRRWANGTLGPNLVDFFVNQLSKERPVAAAFAILNEAEYVWTGEYARASGHIRYPTDKIVEGKRPVAGHSVCLVGYKENLDDVGDNPWTFLFRNSYGTDIFAKDADQFPDRLNTPLPGYGIISARDVKRYCWEFLTFASPDDIELLTGGFVPPVA
jgi:hypothetical protein